MRTLQTSDFEKVDTYIGIILECLHEVYETEKQSILSGTDYRITMIRPFIKMLGNQFWKLPENGIQYVLWEIYQDNIEKEEFCEKARLVLQPYYKRNVDKIPQIIQKQDLNHAGYIGERAICDDSFLKALFVAIRFLWQLLQNFTLVNLIRGIHFNNLAWLIVVGAMNTNFFILG